MKRKTFALIVVCCASMGVLRCSHDALSPSQFSAYSNVSDSALPDSTRRAYYEDAARLALRERSRTNDPANEPVELPDDLVQTFYRALLLVYNAVDLEARDAVVVDYPVHTFFAPDLYRLVIGVDTTQAWVKALRRRETLTGEAQVDQLLQQYELALNFYLPQSTYLVLQSKRPLNIAALGKRFQEVNGVNEAFPNIWLGGDRDIQASMSTRAIHLRYEYGWGDCLSGCLARHYWQFYVHNDGRVEFVREWGSPPPKRK